MRGCRRPASALLLDRRGATTVEFGIIAVPFLAIVLAILELGLVFLASGALDSATAEAARAESVAGIVPTRAAVAERICDAMPGFGRDCGGALEVRLEELDASGGGSTIVVVRAVYRWSLLSPLIGRALAGDDGAIALVAANAFRLESS